MRNLNGVIFNIVNGSFVDGYGITDDGVLKGVPVALSVVLQPGGAEGRS